MACADAVVSDRLANSALLRLAPPGATFIDVGKHSTQHKYTQNEINRILIDLAQQGKTVCRLKGGDPFVFGRGGEEASALHENHIPFIIIPGVSSAIAVPAYAGIPVTDRRYASSFAVITGHGSDESQVAPLPNADTLIYLMGLTNLPHIIQQLLTAGRLATTPVAVIMEGTTPRQRVVAGTLATIVAQVELAGLHSPVVIVIGEVIRLRESLAWYDRRPLFDRRILVTRAQHQADSLATLLAAAGAEPVIAPLIAIEMLPTPENLIARLHQADWLVFTSANGITCLIEHLQHLGYDLRALGTAKIATIGSATAHCLQRLNLHVTFIPEVADAASLAAEFPAPNQQRITIITPLEHNDALGQLLSERGAIVATIPVYRTVPADRIQLPELSTLDAITFASPSAVRSFRALVPGDIGNVTIACLGATTIAAASAAHLPVHVTATAMTNTSLVESLEQFFTKGITP